MGASARAGDRSRPHAHIAHQYRTTVPFRSVTSRRSSVTSVAIPSRWPSSSSTSRPSGLHRCPNLSIVDAARRLRSMTAESPTTPAAERDRGQSSTELPDLLQPTATEANTTTLPSSRCNRLELPSRPTGPRDRSEVPATDICPQTAGGSSAVSFTRPSSSASTRLRQRRCTLPRPINSASGTLGVTTCHGGSRSDGRVGCG